MTTCPRCQRSYPDGIDRCPNDGEPLARRTDAALTEELAPGTIVGEYRIEGPLGKGGFGEVYRAVHPIIQKPAAIKVLNRKSSSDPVMVARFTSEARVVNQIRHRNIVDIFAFGQLPDGRHYHVMELLDGLPLDEHLKKQGPLPFAEASPILRGIARALAAAHAAGVVHRDLKPANVFLVRDEDAGFVAKLIDFGIAKLMDDPGAHRTATGAMMGTAYYMSPEQGRGRPVDARTDIYAFGVLIHVALTGKKPFTGESVMDVVMKHITEEPPRMSSVRPGVPAELDAPVLAMLAKDPAHRPQTVIQALEALEAAARSCGALPPAPSGRGPLASIPAAEEQAGRASAPPDTRASAPPDTTEKSDTAAVLAMVNAKTLLADSTPGGETAGSTAAGASASPRRPAPRIAVAAALALTAAVVVWAALRGTGRPQADPAAAMASPAATAPAQPAATSPSVTPGNTVPATTPAQAGTPSTGGPTRTPSTPAQAGTASASPGASVLSSATAQAAGTGQPQAPTAAPTVRPARPRPAAPGAAAANELDY